MAVRWFLWVCAILSLLPSVFAVNAAYKKKAEAKPTCGELKEKYYMVSMRDLTPRHRNLSVCDQSNPHNARNASNLVDGMYSTWWQSTAALNRANITIDLVGPKRKFYFVDKIVIMFGEYYRPKRMAFWKSSDFGKTYELLHHYVSPGNNPTVAEQCNEIFGVPADSQPNSANDTLCTEYPEGIALDRNQNVALSFDAVFRGTSLENPSQIFLDFINVTNVRIEFYSLERIFDFLAVKWHHYAVREVEVHAFCDCNGQGDGRNCTYNETINDNQCTCQKGSCGFNCEMCCPAYNQFPWKPSQKGPLLADADSACQPCNCHNHSSVCVYNETVAKFNMSMDMDGSYVGGGVCQGCQDNTQGINCEKCQSFFFRPKGKRQGDKDACRECHCSIAGTKNVTLPGVLYLDCVRDEDTAAPRPGMGPGDCICKNNSNGRRCDLCKPGFFNLSSENPGGCQGCTCNTNGTVNASNVCTPDAVGQCPCKKNVEELLCTTCIDTFYDLQDADEYGCKDCDCDVGGSNGPICNKTNGQCPCRPNVMSRQCKRPEDQFYYPSLHFMSGTDGLTKHGETNTSWIIIFIVTQGDNTSGRFILLFIYSSTSSVWVTLTVSSAGASTEQRIMLDSCPSSCTKNLTAFGELALSGEVTVNVTFPTSDLQPQRVVAMPREFYHPTILGNETMAEFLANCSVIEFDTKNNSEMCLAHVFSVTVGYLGHALACDCDPIGSVNFTCQKYAGQCHCKPGVTGRKCDRCQAEFFNFTSSGCSACNCQGDHKVCDTTTGHCQCPDNTVGRMCDQCDRTFWGWNSTYGCQACNCNVTGSADLQCNLTTGVCSCKDGVMSDKCTVCRDEYKNFSNAGCSSCGCDVSGSLNPVCEKHSGQCPCKNNTAGLTCDQCSFGFFYLDEANGEGCTSCTCMGITKNCSITSLFSYQKDVDVGFWDLGTYDGDKRIPVKPVTIQDGVLNVNMIAANISANQTLYWRANKNFTQQSMVGVYGGKISFGLHISKLNGSFVPEAKVILKGVNNISIVHDFPVISPDDLVMQEIDMKESSWVYADSHRTVSREDFMLVLAKLKAFLITASFYESGEDLYQTSLGKITVDFVRQAPPGDVAYDVEQCDCGAGYSGLSCERCARGHHRVNVSGDPFLGECVPCNCHGHSGDCDPDTGECLNCQHNSTGFNCELCMDGFYGDATNETPNDCKTCPCEAPRTTTSLCKAGINGRPQCSNCSIGYEGDICGSCELGYFGVPLESGGTCSLCRCNNNSDICNTTTGECIDCKYNSTGFNCERCENSTWGNATLQQCQDCTCDGVGAYHNVCNHVNGQCVCKPRVNGMNCSRCEVNSYNFTSSGCMECGCNEFGSSNLQCNDSGVCECRNHTLGQKCDLCEWGFFGLPDKTCAACDCNITGSWNHSQCNRTSGKCRCKPGVTARRCDQCKIQHTNFSASGCDACPNCTRMGLQEDINKANKIMEKATDHAKTVSNLKELWVPLENVEDEVDKTEKSYEEFDSLVTSLSSNITHLLAKAPNETIILIQKKLSSLSSQTHALMTEMSREFIRLQTIHDNATTSRMFVSELDTTIELVVKELNDLKERADKMKDQAKTFLNEDYTSELHLSESELVKALDVHAKASMALYNVTSQWNTTDSLNVSAMGSEGDLMAVEGDFGGIRGRVDTVTNSTVHVLILLNHTKILISDGNNTIASARNVLQMIAEILTASEQDVADGQTSMEDVKNVLNDDPGLKSEMRRLETNLSDIQELLDAANKTVQTKATEHAANLTAEAEERQRLYNSTLAHGGRAVAAIKKYEEVVNLMQQSLESSSKANETIHRAMQRLENVTNAKSDLDARANADLYKSSRVVEATLQRDANLEGLKANVTYANQTFWRAVMTGKQGDEQYNVLLSKRDSLLQAAEVGADEHSIVRDGNKTDYWSAEAAHRNEIILNENASLHERIATIDTRTAYINMSAEEARKLMPEALDLVQNASKGVVDVEDKVNTADTLRDEIKSLQADLRRNVTSLQQKLRKIKEYASKIRLALNVKGSTSVQYQPPSRTIDSRSFNEISVDFKPTRAQGTLFFMSGEESTSLLSLSISSEGYVEFKYNLSSVPITNWEIRTRPGKWYRAYATRYGKGARLTVTDFSAMRSRTYGYEDTNHIYSTTEMKFINSSELYLAGLSSDSNSDDPNGNFHGCIDNVRIDQKDLNLWEPISVEGNRTFCTRQPPLARDELYPLVQGASFYGTGYIEQRMGSFNVSKESEMVFEFRTFRENGLLASVSHEQEHIYGVYLNKSRVVFFLKASGQTHKVYSQQASYSDGRWYQVRIIRRLGNVTLTVVPAGAQGGVDVSTVLLNSSVQLSSGSSLFFGGVNRNRPADVPLSTSFAGCMRNVSLSAPTNETLTPRLLHDKNLTVNEPDAVDFNGCLKDVEQGIRFLGDSFVALNNTQRVLNSVVIKFKTLRPSGLLFYSGEVPLLYLALFHGNLFLVFTNSTSQNPPKITEITKTESLNDGAYHTVRITSTSTGLLINLDNGRVTKTLAVSNVVPSGPVSINGTLYVGGLEPNVTIPLTVPVIRPIVGDMKEVILNGISQHMFSGLSHRVSLAGVPPERIVVPTLRPTVRPIPPKCEDSFPALQMSTGDEVNFGTPGSYVGFAPTAEVLDYIEHLGVISVNFRALSPNGVLLYATNDANNPFDFLSLELVNGGLVFKFNAGSGMVRVQSNYNNYSSGGHWWEVRLLRINQFGAMLIPETRDYKKSRVGDTKPSLDINSPIYYGGVPADINTTFLETGGLSFLGCLGDLVIQSANKTRTLKPRSDSDSKSSNFTDKRCYKYVQAQAGFDGAGQLLLDENFELRTSFDMALKFRTTTRSGLLMVFTNISGSSSVTLEKIGGQVAVTFNGEENSTAVWTDPYLPVGSDKNSSYRLCDNKFHEVRLHKEDRDVTLSVDGYNATTTVQAGFTLRGRFYIGGVPGNSGIQGYGGISRVRLTGCVESLRIGDKYIDLIRNTQMHNVQSGCRAPSEA